MNSLPFVTRLLFSPLALGMVAVGAVAYWVWPQDHRAWRMAIELFVGLFAVARGVAQFWRSATDRRWATILTLLGLFLFGTAAGHLYPSLILEMTTLVLMISMASLAMSMDS